MKQKIITILAIETSCDDTGIAVLEVTGPDNFTVLSNIVASQIKVHQKYGGVYPAMAKREHQKNLVPTFIKALKEANMLKNVSENFTVAKNTGINKILGREPELYKKLISFLKKYKRPDIDLISITNGPGLEPCLWVGVNFAKAISFIWNIPVVPVNHIESHILVNFLNPKPYTLNPKSFPAIALVVSGGHTQIILVKKVGSYKILGETRDDAAGECFDKCAKILGLKYPGGPEIAKYASQLQRPKGCPDCSPLIKLPRPMINTKDYDFSFSGLKTAVLYADKKINNKTIQYQKEISAEIQQAIIDILLKKTIKAAKDFNVKSIILGGGVSANKELRKQFEVEVENKNLKINIIYPETNLSTDNGLMTAIAGFYHKKNTVNWKNIQANGNLQINK